MGNYKMNKLSLAAAGILTLGFAAQIGANYTQTEKIAQQVAKQTRMVQMEMNASIMQQRQLTQQIKQMNYITEEFKITEIDNQGYVHGEQPTGGEGIYYSQEFLKANVGNLKIGDEIEITWPREAYDNGDWENVSDIQKIIYK